MLKQKTRPTENKRTFKSKAQHDIWLESETRTILHFKDFGQDSISWHIDAGGEVLRSLQPLDHGKIVDLSQLFIGGPVTIIKEGSSVTLQRLIIDNMAKRSMRTTV